MRIDLSEEQLSAIAQWAEQTRYISEVRLFGSRAKGTSRPDSDIDVAVTIAGDIPGQTPAGLYTRFATSWREELVGYLL
jgi:predicted nucleotidyltransferase